MHSYQLHDVDVKHTNISIHWRFKMGKFENKTVIVTGGAGGIGGLAAALPPKVPKWQSLT
jgi:NADPH:quinone reductase-like Zn-dependent oxidoreductase